MTLTKSKYYFEALDNYPYSLPDCFEALNYALSYDPEDADSLCLMGRIYSEQLRNYETAKQYFQEALQYDLNNISIVEYYIKCLLNNEDYDEAERLIKHSLQIKSVDKANILYYKSLLFERRTDFKNALKQIKEAKKHCYNKDCSEFLTNREKSIKEKIPKKPKTKSKVKSKKKKETN